MELVLCGGIEMKRYRIYNERFIDLEDDEDIESHLESIIESMRDEDFEIEESK